MKKLDLTIILPILNEEENIEKTVDEVIDVVEKTGKSYEVLAINTPDKDDTYNILLKLGKKYPKLYPINMKHKGGERVLQKGYQYMLGFILAKGEKIVHMDSDYEDDPHDIPKMLDKLDEGYDLVVGWRVNRKHKFFYILTSKIYNFLASLVTNVKIHDKNCGLKAYTKSAAKAVKLHGMNFRGIPILLEAKGYRVTEVPINNRTRIGGESKFNFWTRFWAGLLDFPSNVLISKSGDAPFRFWGLTSILSFCFSVFAFVVYCILAFGRGISFDKSVIALAASIGLFMSGLMSMTTGILMEFILHQNPSTLNDYTILDDPKGRVS